MATRPRLRPEALLIALATAALAGASPAVAQPASGQPIAAASSFRIGSSGGLCTAQERARDPLLSDMFDRAFAIVCRDAAVPIGRLYALRLRGGDPAGRLAQQRGGDASCAAQVAESIASLGTVAVTRCILARGSLGHIVYARRAGGVLYVAEGLAGYDSTLRLGLRSLVAGRTVEGENVVATLGAGDPVAFARAQAGSMAPGAALAEAYRRNNRGSFAESAEFFASLLTGEARGAGRAEALINQALQQSNLGRAVEAATLFDEAAGMVGAHPVMTRMLRNYRAIHLLNQGRRTAALAELDRPLPPGAEIVHIPPPGLVEIDAETAALLNAEPPAARGLRAQASVLLPSEKARILDGQAAHLRGVLNGQGGDSTGAAASFRTALASLGAVRDGRVASIVWLRAQIFSELAALAEAGGDRPGAERAHRDAIALLEVNYPASSALLGAQARLASFFARTGQAEAAFSQYRALVDAGAVSGDASPAVREALGPYFALLAASPDRPDAAADMFRASQFLVRPGVAETQAVLARELSGGSDEASRLFRQSLSLLREIERGRTEIARLETASPASDAALIAQRRSALALLEADQVAVQSRLAAFPRYLAVSGGALALADLQRALMTGEGYYKMVVAGDAAFAILVRPESARIFRIGASPVELDRAVDALRATIATRESGRIVTYPFDVATAHRLHQLLFAPFAADLAGISHIIFEPDGAMLRLPPNLLVTSPGSVAEYAARAARPGDEGFDFSGIAWLGRDREVSTAVSARSFRDVRAAARSRAPLPYLGFGQNQPPPAGDLLGGALTGLMGQSGCTWPLAEWARPISAGELRAAGASLSRAGAGRAEIVTGAAFTDSAILARDDLARYRILHFATHGLVTPPRPECPARPALMTSFGGEGSDGLLGFAEIYDLRLDADLIILSACDTAGKSSLAANREAGLAGGGDFALDGLVRAFVGAGGRSILASHWPVPDDYQATERLVSGLFSAPPGSSTARALRLAQLALMDRAETSHPYYWAGFAIIGDGHAAVLPAREGEGR